MHVLDHLIQEHREAEDLLERLSKSDPGPERRRLVDEIDEALTIHMAVEEMFVYPIARRAGEGEEVEEGNTEHDLARDSLVKLHELVDEAGFGAAVDGLKATIDHHVEEEEEDMFPELRREAGEQLDRLDPDQLEDQARAQRGSGGRTGDPTRDELYAQAQEAGIPGRSSMTKDELADALHGK